MTVKEADKQKPSNIFEGMTSIRAVIKAIEDGYSDRKIIRILVDEEKAKKRAKELSYLKAMSYKYDFEIKTFTEKEIDEIALGNTHGGLLLEASDRIIPELTKELLEENHPNAEKRFFVMLEGIEDPYNFGYAVRSIYAAGVDGIILSRRNWTSAAGVVCRASAGASELVRMYVTDTDKCIEVMKLLGIKIVCCDIKNSVSIYDADLKKPLFLCVGGEKRGLTNELLSSANQIIRLDYGRDFPQALSAASAATVAAYEVLRNSR